MGEVYRAHDRKLKRDVALKVLPENFLSDPDRVTRFQREAEALASLNHPNIAAIYGAEESDGIRALVLELVEGDTLAQRLQRGPLPPDEAFDIGKQIAEALEAAHEKGIAHRDLKPANIKITPEGRVKVLDFGLAKMFELAGAGPVSEALTNSPTLLTGTMAGVLVGTVAYMSPEQARGRPTDRASDIWAFGCVLFEMLTGKQAFTGETITDILGAIVKSDPDWGALPQTVPPGIRSLLRRCLHKDRRYQMRDIGDVRIELEEALAEEERSVAASPRRAPLVWIASLMAATLLIVALAIPAVRHLREIPPKFPVEMRLQIVTPYTRAPLQFALSPDGKYIVFVASGSAPQRLWLRALDKDDPQPMTGTDGADYPFWSADSQSIGFFASGKLRRADIAGGLPKDVADAPSGRGGAWNAEGTILFAPTVNSPLMRVSATGGKPSAVIPLDSTSSTSYRFPQFLPDGRHFLFFKGGIYLGSLDGGNPKRLMTASNTAGAFLKPDKVIFMQQGALVARRLDLTREELTGDAWTLADPVGYEGTLNAGGFSVSGENSVAYRAGDAELRQLTWFDRSGKKLGFVGEPDANNLLAPELSPDGRRLAVLRTEQNRRAIWFIDVVRGGYTRFASGVSDNFPLWSPDGTRMSIPNSRGIDLTPISGTGELVKLQLAGTWLQDWSKDGRFLLGYKNAPTTARDLWAFEMHGKNIQPRVVANTPAEERVGQASPDGRWVAYETNQTGRFEIVVQAFPEPSRKVSVSTGGGIQPRWRADGKELYFIAPDGKLMAAPTMVQNASFEAGTPIALFSTRIASGTPALFRPQYAVARDGRFLINQPAEGFSSPPITLVVNWNGNKN